MWEQIKRPFAWYWNVATLKTKLVIAGIVFVLLAVVFLYSCKDTLFVPEDDNAYKVLQGENNVLRQQNAELRKSYEDSIAKGQAMELERDGLRLELERFGRQAAEGVIKQKEAAEQYEKDIAIIGIDIPKLDRCKRYCINRAGEGFPCKPNPDAYCQRYATGP